MTIVGYIITISLVNGNSLSLSQIDHCTLNGDIVSKYQPGFD